ncbi:MAG: flagellar brake protein [Deltaproteobacteria bacterium]|nr:flagellar brake protein [Deltaproteobacteria bacterium]
MFDIKKLKENPDINIYSKKQEINAILKGFANQKKPLIIYAVPFNDEYTTNILKIKEDYMTIDSMIPKSGNLKLIESSYIKVTFKFGSNEHFFLSKLYNYEKDKEYFVFDIYKPIEILSLEKRKFFRIEPSLNEPVKVSFFLNNKYFETKLFDLSGEGLSFLLDFPLEKHTVLENVKIQFPCGLPEITVRFEIRSVSRLDNLKYKVGARAINLKPAPQDVLFKYIFKRQREIVAAMKGTV